MAIRKQTVQFSLFSTLQTHKRNPFRLKPKRVFCLCSIAFHQGRLNPHHLECFLSSQDGYPYVWFLFLGLSFYKHIGYEIGQ